MSLPASARAGRMFAAGVFAVLAVFVVLATVLAVRSNEEQATLSAESDTAGLVAAVRDRMVAYTEVLYGVRSQFSSGLPTREQFHRLIQGLELDDRFQGVQVIGAAHLVDKSDLAFWEDATEAAAQEADLGYPSFEVYPETDLPEALPIDYIEPTDGNLQAFGLDFLSEPNRRAAAERARDTGEATATAPITLVQETGEQMAILVMVPIYDSAVPPRTTAERRASFTGVVYAAFRIGDLLSSVAPGEGPRITEVRDVASGEDLFTLADSPEGSSASADDFQVLNVAGREWSVGVEGQANSLSPMEQALPAVVLVGGLTMAALIAGLVFSIASSRSKATALAREMTRELAAITEAAAEGIISLDENGTIVAWNRGASDIFGADSERMLGRSIDALVPPRYQKTFRRGFRALLDGDSDRLVETSVDLVARRADGTEFPLELSVSRWSAHDKLFVTGFVRDISERVEARRILVRTTEMLVALLGAATEMSIIATDLEGTITVFNRGAERMLGYSSDDVVGSMTPATIHDPLEVTERATELGIEPGFEVFVHAARQGMAETRDWTYVRADGGRLPVELTVTPMYDSNGELNGFIGIAVDITERRRTESAQLEALEQQQQMVDKLTELDQAKSDFVSTTSHELRTPLTSIIGFSELLGERLDDADDADRQLVSMIERNADRLLSLVEDLLVLSRIESGSFRLHREVLDLAPLVQSTCESVEQLASEREIAVRCQCAGPLYVDGDRPQLERVLVNLLTNAVKFSREGGLVEVRAALEGGALVVSVIDNGIGIPEDEQDRVFTRFFRASTAQEIKGTGLGLAIVSGIVQRHDGEVEIHSIEARGTTVTVRLPPATPTPSNDNRQEVGA